MLHGLHAARHPQPPASPQPHRQPRSVTPSSASRSNSKTNTNTNLGPVKPPAASSSARPTTPVPHPLSQDRPHTAQSQFSHNLPIPSTGNAPATPTDRDPDPDPDPHQTAAYINRWSQSTASSPTASDSQQPEETPVNSNPNVSTNTNTDAEDPNTMSGDDSSSSTMKTSYGAPTLPAVSDLSGHAASQPLHFDFLGTSQQQSANIPRPPATTGPIARKPAPTDVASTNPRQTPSRNGESSDPDGDPDGATPRPESRRSGRERKRQGPSQKTMLSRALQKANTAVVLDNATNYEGAIEAYVDACVLLQQVMRRTGGGEERQKLEEIVRLFLSSFILMYLV